MAHAALAVAFRSDKIGIDEGEAEKLAGAIQKVARHYNIPDVASETKDWIALIIVAGTVYGPRMAASWAEKRTPPPAPTAQEADNLITLHGMTGS